MSTSRFVRPVVTMVLALLSWGCGVGTHRAGSQDTSHYPDPLSRATAQASGSAASGPTSFDHQWAYGDGMGIAAGPDGRWIYSGESATDESVVIDADHHKIVDRIRLPHRVQAIDICDRGRVFWVSRHRPDCPWLSRTTIMDASMRVVIQTFTGVGVEPRELELDVHPPAGGVRR